MTTEQTLSIIKPDATRRNLTGKVNSLFEENGLRIIAQKRIQLTVERAKAFYAVHKDKVFYDALCTYMASAPVVVQVLEGEGAISNHRDIMGATNPKEAVAGTVRGEFGISIDENTVHGSDAPDTAAEEIEFFFTKEEIVG